MAKDAFSVNGARWFAVQTLSNKEGKVKQYLDKFIEVEGMEDQVLEILMPTETIVEIKNGKKISKTRKFYPGYLFVHMCLYDDEGKILQKPWHFIKDAEGVINFVGGDRPTPLKEEEIDRILKQLEETQGKEVPKVQFELDEEVKINEGPFLNLTGRITEINEERGRLTVSVSIFGRFTPVELEFWQVEHVQKSWF